MSEKLREDFSTLLSSFCLSPPEEHTTITCCASAPAAGTLTPVKERRAFKEQRKKGRGEEGEQTEVAK